jgi:hypothetical protein
MASGTEAQMSRFPSRLPSTANFMKLEGMNWVWPMAPAQEPSMVSFSTWSCSRIWSAVSSSSRKNSAR